MSLIYNTPSLPAAAPTRYCSYGGRCNGYTRVLTAIVAGNLLAAHDVAHCGDYVHPPLAGQRIVARKHSASPAGARRCEHGGRCPAYQGLLAGLAAGLPFHWSMMTHFTEASHPPLDEKQNIMSCKYGAECRGHIRVQRQGTNATIRDLAHVACYEHPAPAITDSCTGRDCPLLKAWHSGADRSESNKLHYNRNHDGYDDVGRERAPYGSCMYGAGCRMKARVAKNTHSSTDVDHCKRWTHPE